MARPGRSWSARPGIPELERLAGTMEAWWPELLRFLQIAVTNPGTETTNRTVKTAARTTHGFDNQDNQRHRVPCTCTQRQRRASARSGCTQPPQIRRAALTRFLDR